MASIPACHAGDLGSIPSGGDYTFDLPNICPSLHHQKRVIYVTLKSNTLANLLGGKGFDLCAIEGVYNP